MLRLEINRGIRSCDGLTRRDFLRVGGVAVGLTVAELAQLQAIGAAPGSSENACIQLFLVGGPSQLETWDPKPDAPADIRGPFRPIRTNVPGIAICEHFPLMASRADRYAILRSIYHKEAPIHETGHQLIQTGRLSRNGTDWPHFGAVVSKLRPGSAEGPPWVVLPSPIGNTGVSISHGQTAGSLGQEYGPCFARLDDSASEIRVADSSSSIGIDPARLERRGSLVDAVDAAQCLVEAGEERNGAPPFDKAFGTLFSPSAKRAFDIAAEADSVRSRYGWNTFGQGCLLARRLVQHGVRLVTVNMFDTVFGQVTWDCHANGGDLSSTLEDYKHTLCPMLDAAYTALLDDLEAAGLLDTTLVIGMGEFGRTPRLNGRNGRDHWPGVWSGLMAGGGVQGGRVIGSSTPWSEEPKDRPIHASEIAATVYHALGIDPQTRLPSGTGSLVPLVEANPISELF
jgi:hypothetical protein